MKIGDVEEGQTFYFTGGETPGLMAIKGEGSWWSWPYEGRFNYALGFNNERLDEEVSLSPPTQPHRLMKFFNYEHLPHHLQSISAPVCELARQMDDILPDGPEKTAGLRKLMEAKDCFVRTALGPTLVCANCDGAGTLRNGNKEGFMQRKKCRTCLGSGIVYSDGRTVRGTPVHYPQPSPHEIWRVLEWLRQGQGHGVITPEQVEDMLGNLKPGPDANATTWDNPGNHGDTPASGWNPITPGAAKRERTKLRSRLRISSRAAPSSAASGAPSEHRWQEELEWVAKAGAEMSAEAAQTTAEAVNHPPHYQINGLECIDVIEGLGLGFNTGNAIKYLWRNGRKDESKALEDLKKARWYLDREISNLENT